MFVVIDGVDASWKTTQLNLLVDYFKKTWKSYDIYDFPQYDLPSSFFVKEYLSWKFENVTPYQASLFFALDRYYVKDKLVNSIKNKDFVLSNRYTTSNIIHQATKNPDIQDDIINFIEKIEYDILRLPKPDKVIFLDMHIDIAWKLNLQRWWWKWRDIHEQNYDYLKQCYDLSLNLAKKFNWEIVKCYDNDKPLSVDVIHEKVKKVLWLI